jgi:hypothetical protein
MSEAGYRIEGNNLNFRRNISHLDRLGSSTVSTVLLWLMDHTRPGLMHYLFIVAPLIVLHYCTPALLNEDFISSLIAKIINIKFNVIPFPNCSFKSRFAIFVMTEGDKKLTNYFSPGVLIKSRKSSIL